MQSDSRFMAPPSVWLYILAGLVAVGLSLSTLRFTITQGDASDIALGIYGLLVGLWLLLVFRNRNRPVLEIRGGEILYGSVFSFGRRSWRIDDVTKCAGVSRLTGILRLKLRDGSTARIPLREIRRSERARAVALIEERTRA